MSLAAFVFQAFLDGCSRRFGANAGFGASVFFYESFLQPAKAQFPVATLESVLGGHNGDAGGEVDDSDGAFDLVAVLSARSGAAEGMNFDFFAQGIQVGGVERYHDSRVEMKEAIA